jgi:hypothetical protein
MAAGLGAAWRVNGISMVVGRQWQFLTTDGEVGLGNRGMLCRWQVSFAVCHAE